MLNGRGSFLDAAGMLTFDTLLDSAEGSHLKILLPTIVQRVVYMLNALILKDCWTVDLDVDLLRKEKH
jgi:hypothetical protein